MKTKGSRILTEAKIKDIENDLSNTLNQLAKRQSNGKQELVNQFVAKDVIRQAAMKISDIAIDYTCNHFGVKPFVGAEDFSYVGKIVDDTYRIYHYGKDMKSALITLTTVIMAKATISKARQILLLMPRTARMKKIEQKLPKGNLYLDQPLFEVKPVQMESDIIQQLQDEINLDNQDFQQQDEDIDQSEEDQQMVTWETEGDDAVCPECEALEGESWDVNDPSIPTPEEDTHPNCRCRLVFE